MPKSGMIEKSFGRSREVVQIWRAASAGLLTKHSTASPLLSVWVPTRYRDRT